MNALTTPRNSSCSGFRKKIFIVTQITPVLLLEKVAPPASLYLELRHVHPPSVTQSTLLGWCE